MEKELSYDPAKQGYAKANVAKAYFNDTMSKDSACHMLARWLRVNPTLRERLQEVGYNPRRHHFTPMELRIIFDVLGEP